MTEPSDIVELAIEIHNDQWSSIINLFYEKYPNLVGVVYIQDLIDTLLDAIEEDSLGDKYQFLEYAELVGDIVTKFVQGVSKIRGGSVNEG